jgi:PAS domain S-box-containing protein
MVVGLGLPTVASDSLRTALDELVESAEQRDAAQTEARLVEVSEALFRLASLDFSGSAQVCGDSSDLDAVAGCVNMLSEELKAHFDQQARIEVELEDRVRLRTAELEASTERYRALIEGTDAVPWEADARTLALSYISPRTSRLFGEPAAAFVGQAAIWEQVHQDDRQAVRERLLTLADGAAHSGDLEYRFLRRDGQVVEIRSTIATRPALDGSGRILQGIMFDVTAQRRLERRLQQAQKLEAVGRLASGIAHEINTPVQFVSDSLHFVSEAVTDLGPLIQTYRAMTRSTLARQDGFELAQKVVVAEGIADVDYLVENLPDAVSRAISGLSTIAIIVRSMRDFAHPDRGELSAVDLNRALESTLIVAKHEYKNVAELATSFGQIPLVACHGGEINQAILNVVVNAAHAVGSFVNGSEKGLIKVSTWQEGERVVIAIADNGGGIAERDQAVIFDPFFTTKEVGKGTGQGLFIARAIIEDQHGGELSFETRIGAGTTFFIRLPIAGARSKVRSRSAPPSRSSSGPTAH